MTAIRPRTALVSLGLLLVVGAVAACSDDETTGGPISPGGDGGAFTVDSGTPDATTPIDSGGGASCAVANGGCSSDATCSETGGVVTCTCKPGFTGDGKACENVAGSLSGLRWELPCAAAATDPALCTTPTANVTKSTTLAGAPGTTYAVKLRFRGVIEPKTYNGGVETGFFSVGGTPASDTANIYRLTVSAPAATFFVNSGTTRASNALYAEAIDYEATVDIQAGATVTLTAEPLDALQIKNRDQAGAPFVIPGIAPAPAAFDGQFVQMDVLAVTKK
ncbi:MAG: hypothetical protein JST00_09975 [Deltaproteobacteria bacterium]|nr:hypothetical protein [Deltaproteobacteria bacterium]